MCLIIYAPALEYQPENGVTGPTERQSLYLATRSLIAQTQVSQPPSLPLIQASLLLAVYEYINGNPEHALVTMAGTVRMAYVTRMHSPGSQQLQTRLAASPASNANFLLQQSEEVANTWWGIIIYERCVLATMLFETAVEGKES